MNARTKSYIWGGISAAICLIIGICLSVNSSDFSNFGIFAALGVMSFTLVSCIILDNNFIEDMVLDVLDWGFVEMPGVIFQLDLEGLVWLLTVKLLFWILGIALALLCGILAIALGLVISVFVYPFALCKHFKDEKNGVTTV